MTRVAWNIASSLFEIPFLHIQDIVRPVNCHVSFPTFTHPYFEALHLITHTSKALYAQVSQT